MLPLSPERPTLEDRRAAGRALRRDIPRSSHAEFQRSPDLDPVQLILSQEEGRLQNLMPVRRKRMAESPFAFYRAGAQLMAADLSSTPRTDLLVQASGDAHLSNFGWYGSPERHVVFDTNDFDETLQASWEWDVKRLAASFAIASQDGDFGTHDQRRSVRAAVRSYQDAMRKFASMPVLDVWYAHVSADLVLDELRAKDRSRKLKKATKAFKKISRKDSRHVLGKLAERVNGRYRIIDDSPFVVPIRSVDLPVFAGDVLALVDETVEEYTRTLGQAMGTLMRRFRVVDVALKVVGVGSVGTRCFVVLFEGNEADDVLFLQIKEAGRSCLEEEFGRSPIAHAGQRVVEGQRLMQTTSDILLGWTTSSTGREYYVRQLKDMKGSPDVEAYDPSDMERYAGVCGTVLAHSHARSGDSVMIATYLGANDTFSEAIADFSLAYAQQNRRDFEAFITETM